MKSIDRPAFDHTTIAYSAIARAATSGALEVELLAAGGIRAEVVYEGDAKGCTHCVGRVPSEIHEGIAPEVWAA